VIALQQLFAVAKNMDHHLKNLSRPVPPALLCTVVTPIRQKAGDLSLSTAIKAKIQKSDPELTYVASGPVDGLLHPSFQRAEFGAL